MPRRTLLILAFWILAFCIGLALDRPVAEWVHAQQWDRKPLGLDNKHGLIEAMKLPGQFVTTIIAAGLLLVFYPKWRRAKRWEAAGLVAGAGALTGLGSLVKWTFGRRRPVAGIDPFNIELFIGGMPGLFGAEKNLSFPSGHAAMAFATASALGLLLPRWSWLFYAAAAMTAAERIAENAHYVSDSVVGAAAGCLATWSVVTAYVWAMRKRCNCQLSVATCQTKETRVAVNSATS